MTRHRTQKGFTLVELAIVLVIVGLLIGGMLKGRQLIDNARVTATVSQMAGIETAMVAFRSTYNGLPGDIKDADTRIPNCANCTNITSASGRTNDGKIGDVNWNGQVLQSSAGVSTPPTDIQNETLLFWAELNNTDMLTGVAYNGGQLGPDAALFGQHMPAAKVGGGFAVSHMDGNTRQVLDPASTPSYGTFLSGTTLLLNSTPVGDLTSSPGTGALTPMEARQIDTKLDDGAPMMGRVQVFGYSTTNDIDGCFADNGPPPRPPMSYNEKLSGMDCGIAFQIK